MKTNKRKCIEIIIDNITAMLDNNKDYGTDGIAEPFCCWCEEGDIFEDKKTKKQCVDYMVRIAPLVDSITDELFNIFEEIEKEEDNEK